MFKTIVPREIEIIDAGGKLGKSIYSTGTMMAPPPIPKNALTIPTDRPVTKSIKNSINFRVNLVFLFVYFAAGVKINL